VVPLQPFYLDATGAPPAVRLCFAKNDSTLDEAAKRLNHWKNQNPL
jgi:aspartate/methionine/tyrosine aminotransferase